MFKYYYDFISQPSRALHIIFKLSKTSFEDCPVALRKGSHLTNDFKNNVNRFQKVPCIVTSDGFQLSESIAILRFLDSQGIISKNLYPTDHKIRARVDEYLEWQHLNTRMGCGFYFRKKFLEPVLMGLPPNEEINQFITEYMETVLDKMESTWLQDSKYLSGENLTAADIFGACEILQTILTGYNATKNRPNLKRWLDNVKHDCNPYYDEAHKFIYLMADKNKSKL